MRHLALAIALLAMSALSGSSVRHRRTRDTAAEGIRRFLDAEGPAELPAVDRRLRHLHARCRRRSAGMLQHRPGLSAESDPMHRFREREVTWTSSGNSQVTVAETRPLLTRL